MQGESKHLFKHQRDGSGSGNVNTCTKILRIVQDLERNRYLERNHCGEKVNTCSNVKEMVQDPGMRKHLFENLCDCSGLGEETPVPKSMIVQESCQ